MSTDLSFLFLNSDYPEFLRNLYAEHPGLEERPYEEQMQARNESLFGVADFYPANMRELGHEARGLHVNNEFMQKAWAREHGPARSERRWEFRLRRKIVPWVSRVEDRGWFYDILAAQIKYYRPDVLLNQAMDSIGGRFLKELRPHVRLLVGQHAAPLPRDADFSCYDLVVSSLPNFVEYFRRAGVPSELHRLAFEPRVLSSLKDGGPGASVSFVGSLSASHESRVGLLEYLCRHEELKVWGRDVESLPEGSCIRRHYQGKAWGTSMYQVLHSSKMTLNHHIDIADGYANNMRLFEATGVGVMLITDWKENLHEMFEPGREVVAYRSPEECAQLIDYYLEHEDEREAIARAGQRRTLREHTYYRRMQELLDIVRKYI